MVQRKFRCRSGAAWLAAVGAVLASGCPVARQLPTGELPLPVIERTAAKPPLTGDGAAAAAGEGEPAYGHKAEIDFEQENGKIFQNWPRPKLALLFSAKLDGYIEPCGCTGLENQKGGLSRRHSLILQLEKQGWTLLNLDAGGIVRRLGPQAAIKYQRAIDALKTMNYRAVGFGIRELTLPTEELLATLPADGDSPFVCANVSSVFDEDFHLRTAYRIIDVAGMRIGVTSVLGSQEGKQLRNPDFQFRPPVEALPPVVARLQAEKCDLLILLANATIEEAQQLARQFPAFDYCLAAGDSDPPSDRLEAIEGTRTRLIELGHKGMYVGVLGLFDDANQPLRYQRVPLDGRFPDSEAMTAMMASYQDQLQAQGLAGLGLRPSPHPAGTKFIGSETCGECHTDAYEIWEHTPHAHATETLVKLPIARQFDPECLSCHATGWEPQEYYPFVGGYLDLKQTAHVTANGCENCHGPGEAHVAAESGEVEVDERELERLRDGMRLTLEEARKQDCARCHDLDNSPDFDFETYWPQVEHKGKN